jgi:hypothetical protein
MVNRLSPKGVLTLLYQVDTADALTDLDTPPLKAVVLDTSSTVEANLNTAATISALGSGGGAVGLYGSGHRATVVGTLSVASDSVVKLAFASFTFTNLPADDGGGTPKYAKYVLVYLSDGGDADGTSIPLALFQPDFVGTPPDGTNYTLTFPTTGAIRLETA